ncbi:MAG: asparaginase [Chloroflexi bacterium]|nr:asparaginase [Chloroflexota bacterium]
MLAARDALRAGGSALDAVEAGIREVELNAADTSVGLGGYPNILGEVQLDAGIMDGSNRAVGAVAAVRGYAHPISVARQVMLRLPHVLLVGEGAERFAAEIDAERSDLLTPESRQAWLDRLERFAGVRPEQLADHPDLTELVWRAMNEQRRGGTVDFLALDAKGNLAAGVSTSGYAWKYPGRVGDSPICGAGYYCDNRGGAAACTGVGEMAIRAGTARSVSLMLQFGYSVAESGTRAMQDLVLPGAGRGSIELLVLNPHGVAAGFATAPTTYLAISPDMDEPEVRERTVVRVEPNSREY